jgi:hypothetical protein
VIYLYASLPQSLANVHALLEHASEALAAKSHDKDIDLAAAHSAILLTFHSRLGDGEDAVDTNRDADTGDLGLGLEHAHQVVVSAAGGDTAHADGRVVGSVVVVARRGFGLFA